MKTDDLRAPNLEPGEGPFIGREQLPQELGFVENTPGGQRATPRWIEQVGLSGRQGFRPAVCAFALARYGAALNMRSERAPRIPGIEISHGSVRAGGSRAELDAGAVLSRAGGHLRT